MILEPHEVRDLYRRNASWYDLALLPYRILGLRSQRRRVVDALDLQPGDRVVDLCCGTGANFPFLHEAVGPEGRIIGVDLADAMLDRARRKAEESGFRNVDLVEADVVQYTLPADIHGVLATFGLEMVEDYDLVIHRTAAALPEGGRLALLGLKHPKGWPRWLVDVAVWLNRPFGVRRGYADLRPWQSVRKHLREVEHGEMLFGAAYLSVGEVTSVPSKRT